MINFKETYDTNRRPTKAEIARNIGVSEETIRNWYNGDVKPYKKHQKALIEYFESIGMEVVYKN